MNAMKKKVNVKLQTVIHDNGQKEYNDVQGAGNLFQKGNKHVLTFEETMDEEIPVKNMITIQANSVHIKRTGVVSMNQRFQTGQLTENVYKHPYGTIHMETYTTKLEHHQKDDRSEGKLSILYTVKMNGQDERKHELELRYKEEDSE
ncbi:DUF1934 domain-containing protein [Oceanobacillus senegalensis]|uniref:DUF1934 domain-containing protein n=1 Tax=Oceanobacillus senegalensis TaxID=1936063 RepID=UPI000A310913|nr:DUF1934 domain-containing protein [Oceanobacillus senegalensis]